MKWQCSGRLGTTLSNPIDSIKRHLCTVSWFGIATLWNRKEEKDSPCREPLSGRGTALVSTSVVDPSLGYEKTSCASTTLTTAPPPSPDYPPPTSRPIGDPSHVPPQHRPIAGGRAADGRRPVASLSLGCEAERRALCRRLCSPVRGAAPMQPENLLPRRTPCPRDGAILASCATSCVGRIEGTRDTDAHANVMIYQQLTATSEPHDATRSLHH